MPSDGSIWTTNLRCDSDEEEPSPAPRRAPVVQPARAATFVDALLAEAEEDGEREKELRLEKGEVIDIGEIEEGDVRFVETPFSIAARLAGAKRIKLRQGEELRVETNGFQPSKLMMNARKMASIASHQPVPATAAPSAASRPDPIRLALERQRLRPPPPPVTARPALTVTRPDPTIPRRSAPQTPQRPPPSSLPRLQPVDREVSTSPHLNDAKIRAGQHATHSSVPRRLPIDSPDPSPSRDIAHLPTRHPVAAASPNIFSAKQSLAGFRFNAPASASKSGPAVPMSSPRVPPSPPLRYRSRREVVSQPSASREKRKNPFLHSPLPRRPNLSASSALSFTSPHSSLYTTPARTSSSATSPFSDTRSFAPSPSTRFEQSTPRSSSSASLSTPLEPVAVVALSQDRTLSLFTPSESIAQFKARKAAEAHGSGLGEGVQSIVDVLGTGLKRGEAKGRGGKWR